MSDVSGPGSDEYRRATAPHNPITPQHPAAVVPPVDAAGVAAAVRTAASRGLVAQPQATGHGAGMAVGDDVLLIDTSGLDAIAIDAAARTAVVGAGATWGAVNAAAWPHGLLGRAGSAPSVAVCGYTFGAGIGWLIRPHGTAASALRRVEYVDGAGRVRTAADDAPDTVDREAIAAFRGGGGVGIATELEFGLVLVPDLHAGYLLWPVDALDAVVGAWAASIDEVGDAVATSIAVLRIPPAPTFPETLRGQQAVHLAIASSDGEEGALPLLDAMRAAAEPAVDTWGPADSQRLSGIHLDPPPGAPAHGVARWLTADLPAVAVAVLRSVVGGPLPMAEIRSVGTAPGELAGAAAAPAGPFLVHAVGAPRDDVPMAALRQAFDAVLAAAAPADTGLSLGSWVEGSGSVPDALPPQVRARVAAVADAVDPDGVIRRSRFLA